MTSPATNEGSRSGGRSITIVLTYAVGVENCAIGLESSAIPFFTEILAYYEVVTVAALVNPVDPVRGLTYLAHERLQLIPVGSFAQAATRWKRLRVYVAAIATIVRTVARGNHFYIFAPSHVSIMFMIACALLRKRYAVYLRGDWESVTPFPLRGMKKFLLRRSDFVLVTGEKFLREVNPYHRACRKVVPMMSFAADSEAYERRSEPRVPLRLLFVGQVIAEKGIFELLDAFNRVRATHSELELTFVGHGHGMAELRAQVTNLRLDNCVHFAGYVTDIEQLRSAYRESDMFVLPTYFPEGFPRVLYEAMLYSLPIITTNAGGIAAMMIDGENCLLVRQRDAAGVERAIVRLIDDPPLRERLGRAGYAHVKEMLTELDAGASSHAQQFVAMAQGCGWPAAVPAPAH
jgi:glycosyltransferase involved in cell wall biosynthesis